MWLFGSSEPDPEPPTVAITGPQDGQEFVAPATVTITVEASDNVGVAQVDLYVDGVNQNAPLTVPPYEWKDAMFPAGTFCLTAEARDEEPNIVMSEPVCFTVIEQSEPGGSTGEEPGGTSGAPMPGDPGTETGSEPQGGETTGAPETGGDSEGEGEGDSEGDSDSGDAGGDSTAGGPVTPPGPLFPPGWPHGDDDDDSGCGCTQEPSPGAAGLVVLLGAFAARRRRRR
nr:Ig-like domain-containing protein [Nannocystis sp. SCPEA4]